MDDLKLAFDEDFAGSMKYKNINGIHKITANHVDNIDDNGIAVYRAVDGIHDFETGLKKKANTLLREHYGIGDRKQNDDFIKNIKLKDGRSFVYVNNKTTANKNNLHQNLDFNELGKVESNGKVTVSYPDSRNQADKQFEHDLPTILQTMNLDDIIKGETIMDLHPKGDILMDIIINDKKNIDVNKLQEYLQITPGSTYSKDAANIATETFVELFGGNDYSFFSEILDPASEQSDMINKNVEITMVYCYLKEVPIYITLKKEEVAGKPINSFYFQNWKFCFHTGPVKPVDIDFKDYNFGIIKSGRTERHPAPNIETTVQYILGTIEKKTFSKMAAKITSAAKRVLNKGLKKAKGREALSKEQTQNLKNDGSFDSFYATLLKKFTEDIKRNITPAEATVVLISFKTIGDQMYLYDAILLSELSKQLAGAVEPGPLFQPGEPFVVSGDTFLVDYITYTKSCNVLSPATMGNVSGKRKLRVYIKPIDPDAAHEREIAIKEEKTALLIADIKKTIGVWAEYQGVENENEKYNAIQQVVMQKAEQFQQIIGKGKRATYTYVFNDNDVDEFYVVETLYKILFCLYNLETMKTNIKNLQELNANIEGENLTDILRRLSAAPMDVDGNEAAPMDDIVKRAGEINTYYKNILSIVKENEELVRIITDSFEIYNTATGTEYDKQISLHTLYSEMATSKNKYKPGYHYLSAKHGQLDKMKHHLAEQRLRLENRQEGGGEKRRREEDSEQTQKYDIMKGKYADTQNKIDIITEIIIELNNNLKKTKITNITELVDHIENIVDGEDRAEAEGAGVVEPAEEDAMAVVPEVVKPAEEDAMAVVPAVVDNYKSRRDALKEEEDAEVVHSDIPLLFEISDILNTIDDYNEVERIFSDVEGRLALPPAPQEQQAPQRSEAQQALPLPLPPLPPLPPLKRPRQEVLATGPGGKPKKKKKSLKKKKSSKNQTKSKKKKTKRMQIKKRKQTKKKRRN